MSELNKIKNFTLQNSSVPNNINLLDLLNVDSQEFLITFKDSNFIPTKDALLDIKRHYIAEGTTKTVEIPKSDADGNAKGHFVLAGAIYDIIVTKDGSVLGTFTNIDPFCNNQATGDCKIALNSYRSGSLPYDFISSDGVAYSIDFNQTSKVVSSTFTTVAFGGGSAVMVLNVTKFDNYGNQTICSPTITGSSGTLTCTVPSSFGNGTILTQLYKDGKFLGQRFFTIKQTASATFGLSRVIMVILLVVTLPLMILSSGTGVIIMGIVGLIIASLLNIIEGGTIIGYG